jgi:hypothetical protein
MPKTLAFAVVNSCSIKYPASLLRMRSPSWPKSPRHLIRLRGQGWLRAAGTDRRMLRRRRATAGAGRREAVEKLEVGGGRELSVAGRAPPC